MNIRTVPCVLVGGTDGPVTPASLAATRCCFDLDQVTIFIGSIIAL